MKTRNDDETPEWVAEVMADAQSYLELGHEAWREADLLAEPEEEPDVDVMNALGIDRKQELDGYRLAMEQLASGNGFDVDHPLEGLDIDGFYRLASLMHWELKMQKILHTSQGWIVDAMIVQHPHHDEPLTIFNKVPTPSARRSKRKGHAPG